MTLRITIAVVLCFAFAACSENTSSSPTPSKTASTQTRSTADSTEHEPTAGNGKNAYESYKETIKDLPAALKGFVPEGCTVIDTASGDLNRDQYTDLLMVLKNNIEDTAEADVRRPLLILRGQPGNSYTLAAKNDNAVYCIHCGGMMGDPFMGLVIKNGYFSIEHYGGSGQRWTRTITFKYSSTDSTWLLHKDGHENFHAAEPGKVQTRVYTTKDFGKLRFEQFDIYKENTE